MTLPDVFHPLSIVTAFVLRRKSSKMRWVSGSRLRCVGSCRIGVIVFLAYTARCCTTYTSSVLRTHIYGSILRFKISITRKAGWLRTTQRRSFSMDSLSLPFSCEMLGATVIPPFSCAREHPLSPTRHGTSERRPSKPRFIAGVITIGCWRSETCEWEVIVNAYLFLDTNWTLGDLTPSTQPPWSQ